MNQYSNDLKEKCGVQTIGNQDLVCCLKFFSWCKLEARLEGENLDFILLQGTADNEKLLKFNELSALRLEYFHDGIVMYGNQFSHRELHEKNYLDDALSVSNSILMKIRDQYFAIWRTKCGVYTLFNSHGDGKRKPASVVQCKRKESFVRHITKFYLKTSACRENVRFIPMHITPREYHPDMNTSDEKNKTSFSTETSTSSLPSHRDTSNSHVAYEESSTEVSNHDFVYLCC